MTPPQSSCIPLARAALGGRVTRRAMIVPAAHIAAAARMMTTPTTEICAEPPPRPDSRATPARPRPSPAAGQPDPGVVQHRVDADQPQRHGRDQQRGQPRRHGLLADADHGVGHQQQHAHHRAAQPTPRGVASGAGLGWRWPACDGGENRWPQPRPAAGGRDPAGRAAAGGQAGARAPGPQPERERGQAGHQVPGGRHEQRRHRLHADPDGQVGAPPHDVHDEQARPGDHGGPARRSVSSSGVCSSGRTVRGACGPAPQSGSVRSYFQAGGSRRTRRVAGSST